MHTLLTIAQYCLIIGLHPQSLRKLERLGISTYIKPIRTIGNHRRYAIPTKNNDIGITVGYARVSCADQKEDLPRQVSKLEEYKKDTVIITDIGSGLNCRKAGLTKLVKLLLSETVKELVLTYKDRLLRFGSEIIFLICKLRNVTVTILQDTVDKPYTEQFCDDVLSIITVFSSRLYGSRSHKNRKASSNTQLRSTF